MQKKSKATKSTKAAVKPDKSSSNGNSELVAGFMRPGTAAANIFLALKKAKKGVSWKDLKKAAPGADIKNRVYFLKREGKKAKPKFTVEIADDKVKLLGKVA